jgi:hypothetical protein
LSARVASEHLPLLSWIQIQHLAVSALIRSGIINEMEGGSLLGFDLLHSDVPDMPMGARTSYDDSAIAGAAFKVLKQVRSRSRD